MQAIGARENALFFRTFAVGTCVASVTGHFRARLSLARALTRQPVSVFCVHSFTWVLHCVVNEGFEGEGLAFFLDSPEK